MKLLDSIYDVKNIYNAYSHYTYSLNNLRDLLLVEINYFSLSLIQRVIIMYKTKASKC